MGDVKQTSKMLFWFGSNFYSSTNILQESFVKAKDELLSFAFVREPFERLASAYWDKMDRNWTKVRRVHDYQEMRDEIIKK